jgi:arylsulfatase A-like enzyme
MKRLLLFLLLVFSAIALHTQPADRYVVIAVIDGARFTETLGDPNHQYIPRLWNTLRPQGIVYMSFYNNGVTSTTPGHSSILSGVWQYIANDGSEHPHSPTVFEYYRKAFGRPADDVRVILGKKKLVVLAASDAAGYGNSYAATVNRVDASLNYNDSAAADNARRVILSERPRISIINFPETDNAAHQADKPWYLKAIHGADSLIVDLWERIQRDSVLHGKTTLFVTNDHGRHLDGVKNGFIDHGDSCAGCRHIMCIAVGPDITPGTVENAVWEQIDIAPTVGALFGFPTPYAAGRVMPWAALKHAVQGTKSQQSVR